MQASNRIIANTLAQYIRTILNVLLSLYSARLVLDYLGVEDYGIYTLVAGVVSLLSFLTNSLISSTQRFLSYNQGKGDLENMKGVFSNSLLLHIILGLLIALVLESFTSFLFSGFLNIPVGREKVAEFIYQLVVVMVYISFMSAPYRALLTSRENIVYISVIDVTDGILKVVLVLLLPFLKMDNLMVYGCIMFFISCFNLLSFSIYAHLHYEECILPKLRYFSWDYVKRLFSFTGWVTYSALCITFRTQGLAVVLNKMMCTAINAAYGIGGQISGMVSFVSSSLNNAIAPQLMASEGKGDRERMWMLAKVESKFSFLLLAMVGIPTIFEMDSLLQLWLKDVPPYASLFARMFLTMQIIDMLTIGLALANKAIGNIGFYTVITLTPKLLILPIGWIFLKLGYSLISVCLLMIGIETVCMLVRIPLLRRQQGFNAWDYVKDVFIRPMMPILVSITVCFLICSFLDFQLRFLITYFFSILLCILIVYKFTLSNQEKRKVDNILNLVKKKVLKINYL